MDIGASAACFPWLARPYQEVVIVRLRRTNIARLDAQFFSHASTHVKAEVASAHLGCIVSWARELLELIIDTATHYRYSVIIIVLMYTHTYLHTTH